MVDAVESATEPQNDLLPSISLGTILIIEDEPRMQRTLQRAFAHEHYATVISGDGQSGLDLFRSEHPLAVVLDLILAQYLRTGIMPHLQAAIQRDSNYCAERNN